MNPSHIPSECDPQILFWSNQGLSWRAIEQKLLDEKGVRTTYRSVGRRLTAIRNGRGGMLDSMEREVWAMLGQNLSELDHAEDQLATINELAIDGDAARGIKPDLRAAMRIGIRRIELILNKHRLYQTVLTEARQRALAGAEVRLDDAAPAVAATPALGGARETVQAGVPGPEATVEAVPGAAETVRETVGETASPVEKSATPASPEPRRPVTRPAALVWPQARSDGPRFPRQTGT